MPSQARIGGRPNAASRTTAIASPGRPAPADEKPSTAETAMRMQNGPSRAQISRRRIRSTRSGSSARLAVHRGRRQWTLPGATCRQCCLPGSPLDLNRRYRAAERRSGQGRGARPRAYRPGHSGGVTRGRPWIAFAPPEHPLAFVPGRVDRRGPDLCCSRPSQSGRRRPRAATASRTLRPCSPPAPRPPARARRRRRSRSPSTTPTSPAARRPRSRSRSPASASSR